MPKSKLGKPEEYPVELLESELRRVNGKVYIAAKAIGCTAKTLYRYFERYPHLKELVDEFRQVIVDKAELALESAITDKEAWAVCFTLKTLGKDRGYVERNENKQDNFDYNSSDLSLLNDYELERLIAGDDPRSVFAAASKRAIREKAKAG